MPLRQSPGAGGPSYGNSATPVQCTIEPQDRLVTYYMKMFGVAGFSGLGAISVSVIEE
jgi:hypothetical protein